MVRRLVVVLALVTALIPLAPLPAHASDQPICIRPVWCL